MNNLQIKYSELLSVSITQLFYENKVAANYTIAPTLDFMLVPTYETVELMKRMDLIFKNAERTGGFTLLARTNGKLGPNDLLRYAATKSDKLTFLLLLKNSYLLNYNDLPISKDAEQLFYFTNEITDLAAPRNLLHLSQDVAGVKSANDSVKKAGEFYRYHHGATVAAGSAKVKHLLTGEEITVQSLINEGGQADLTFDLSVLPLGKCQLLISGTVEDEFYNLGQHIRRDVFGVIELQLSSMLNANYRIIESDRSLTPTRPLFNICFINRKTVWRYTLKLQPNSPLYTEMAVLSPPDKIDFLNRLKIVSNDTNITFTQYYADDTAISFQSDNPVALQEKYLSSSSMKPLSLTLKKYTGIPAKEAAVKPNLPYPSVAVINAINFPSIYSDIFLTL